MRGSGAGSGGTRAVTRLALGVPDLGEGLDRAGLDRLLVVTIGGTAQLGDQRL